MHVSHFRFLSNCILSLADGFLLYERIVKLICINIFYYTLVIFKKKNNVVIIVVAANVLIRLLPTCIHIW